MAESTGASDDKSVTFHVKSAGGQKYTLTLPLSTSTVDLKNKLSTEEYANVSAASQRLIYSGKVLKDTDTLATHNVKDGNTMHLVKSAPSNQRQNPANQSSPSSTQTPASNPPPNVPQTFAAGTGNDPLAGLTGARYAGFAQLPSASMFQNPPNPEDMIRQMQDPNFAQMMRETLNNPQMIDMMINSSPQLRAMGPQARQMLQSEHFRRMMTDPEALRSMMEMQRMMGADPFGGMGGGGQGAFPAPGVTNTTDPQNTQTGDRGQGGQNPPAQQNPFAALGGMGMNPFMNPFMNFPGAGTQPTPTQAGSTPAATTTTADTNRSTDTTTNPTSPSAQQQQANPFAALFNPAMFQPPQYQQQNPSDPNNTNNPSNPLPYNPWMNNPFLNNPEAMNQFLRSLGMPGGGGQAANPGSPGSNTEGGNTAAGAPPFNIMDLLAGGGGYPSSPPDSRPPAERFATELRRLNEMGFFDYDRNIQALSRSGGDVNGALDWLLSQPQ